MADHRIVIPDESLTIGNFEEDDLPGIVAINKGLLAFEHRALFPWQLSVIIDFAESSDTGMPSVEEREIVDVFGDELGAEFRGADEEPNGLFLARVTWNGTRQLLYRLHEPESVHEGLQRRIQDKDHPREFDYQIEADPDWKLASWYMDACSPPDVS